MEYEKLLAYLNCYEPYIQSDLTHTDNFWWYVSQGHSAVFPKEVGVERIISKSYGFIDRLVKKYKVDLEKLLNIQNEYFRLQIGNDNYNSENYFVDGLLMLLAIQDEPIEFLISILK